MDTDPAQALTRLSNVARKRAGCVTRQQAYAEGVSPARFDRLVATNVLTPMHKGRGVYRFAAAPASWDAQVHAATLAAKPEAVVSHRSAARLWNLDGFGGTTAVDLALPGRKTRRKLDGVTVHLTGWLPEPHIVALGDHPRVSSVPRTLRDLARYLDDDRLLEVVVDACRRKLTDAPTLARMHLEVGRAWGAQRMERVLEELKRGCLDAASVPELHLHRSVLGDRRFPPHLLNHTVQLASRRVVFDLAWPELLAATEVDSDRYHSTDYDRRRDAQRDAATREAGWVVERVRVADLANVPDVLDRLAAFIADAQRSVRARRGA